MGLTKRLAPLIFGLLAIGYMVIASGFGDETSAEAPMLYGAVLLGLSVLVGLLGFLPTQQTREAAKAHDGDAIRWHASFGIYAIIAGFIALIFLAGFYVAIAAFLVLFLIFHSRVSVLNGFVFAALACGFTWLVFSYFLHLNVFSGYLIKYV